MQPDWWEVRKKGVGTNRYAYSFNDPVNLSDRNGHASVTINGSAVSYGTKVNLYGSATNAQPLRTFAGAFRRGGGMKPSKRLLGPVGAALSGYAAMGAAWESEWGQSLSGVENGVYSAEAMGVFRQGYTESNEQFMATALGRTYGRTGQKYILIPANVMPTVAAVDADGMMVHGDTLTWDPAGSRGRRQAATGGLGRAGIIPWRATGAGPSVFNTIGSWEEYPYASTAQGGAGSHVGAVPLMENWIQGGFIRAASMVQGFRPGDTIKVVIMYGN